MQPQISQDELSQIRVEAKTSLLDMIIGPPIISAMLAGILTYGTVRIIVGEEVDLM